MPGKLMLAVSSLIPVEPAAVTVHTGQIDGAAACGTGELPARRYALAASRYRVPHGHSVPEAVRDQPALVSWFSRSVARPDL